MISFKMALLKEKDTIKLPAYYTDSRSWRTCRTKIEIDLVGKTQKCKNTRNIRAVWVTPILQKEGIIDTSQTCADYQPIWSVRGPRLRDFGPPEARSQEEEEDASVAASGASAGSAGASPAAAEEEAYLG